jgi:integrase
VFLQWCAGESIASIGQLDRRTFDRFTAQLLTMTGRYGKELSRHTVHSYVGPVRLFLTWAEREGEAVAAKPQLPRRPRLQKDALSREQIDRMESAAPQERDKLIVRLFGDCGLRLSELMAIEIRSIIRSGHTASLAIRGKGDRERRVPLTPNLLRRLDRLIAALPKDRTTDRIFLSSRRNPGGSYEPLTDSGVKQAVADTAKRAGVGRTVHPHLLRHSWMTEMLRRGMNPLQLRVIAGASPEVIARHYEHLTEEDAHKAMIAALTRSERR